MRTEINIEHGLSILHIEVLSKCGPHNKAQTNAQNKANDLI